MIYHQDSQLTLHNGDALEVLRGLPSESVNCCVTSPPYFGLRDYGVDGQIGLEPTPEGFIARLVEVFREVRRVLKDDGTCWVNIGDSYAGSGPSGASYQSKTTLERADKATDGNFRISKTLGSRGLTYAEKKPIPPRPRYRLKADLTEQQVNYVLSELLKARAISEETQEGRV